MKKLDAVFDNLKEVDRINRTNHFGENESYLLSIELLDLEESAASLCNLIPTLYSKSSNKEETEDILNDIGEELRHILYHIKKSNFYGYINE